MIPQSKAPERVWMRPENGKAYIGTVYSNGPCDGEVEYVRADVAAMRIRIAGGCRCKPSVAKAAETSGGGDV